MRWSAFKKEFHRTIDPLIVWRHEQRERACLRDLLDGEYRVPLAIPYVSQFASPELIPTGKLLVQMIRRSMRSGRRECVR